MVEANEGRINTAKFCSRKLTFPEIDNALCRDLEGIERHMGLMELDAACCAAESYVLAGILDRKILMS